MTKAETLRNSFSNYQETLEKNRAINLDTAIEALASTYYYLAGKFMLPSNINFLGIKLENDYSPVKDSYVYGGGNDEDIENIPHKKVKDYLYIAEKDKKLFLILDLR